VPATTYPDAVELMEALGLTPDPWQAELLRSEARQLLMLCCRQSGKSTTAAIAALFEALSHAGSLILVLSPSLRQSQELYRKIIDDYLRLEHRMPAEQATAYTLQLANHSRIVSLPGGQRTVRGYSAPRLVVIDEAAQVDDDLFHAIKPMLAVSQGKLVALSTPYGQRGWFHREWTQGASWHKVKLVAEQCPRIAPAFLSAEQASLPAWIYEQEYHCVFGQVEGAVFRIEDVRAIFMADDDDDGDDDEPVFTVGGGSQHGDVPILSRVGFGADGGLHGADDAEDEA
jgi:hypothetical protein